MSNVVEQLTPNPVTHEHGENGCCPDTRAWEMEMMHQVWAAGLHDAANCFQDALEAKWERDAKKAIATNGDRIRAMTDEDMANFVLGKACPPGEWPCRNMCKRCWLTWLKSPVEESHE